MRQSVHREPVYAGIEAVMQKRKMKLHDLAALIDENVSSLRAWLVKKSMPPTVWVKLQEAGFIPSDMGQQAAGYAITQLRRQTTLDGGAYLKHRGFSNEDLKSFSASDQRELVACLLKNELFVEEQQTFTKQPRGTLVVVKPFRTIPSWRTDDESSSWVEFEQRDWVFLDSAFFVESVQQFLSDTTHAVQLIVPVRGRGGIENLQEEIGSILAKSLGDLASRIQLQVFQTTLSEKALLTWDGAWLNVLDWSMIQGRPACAWRWINMNHLQEPLLRYRLNHAKDLLASTFFLELSKPMCVDLDKLDELVAKIQEAPWRQRR
jgi:hypothetical protein